jgi:hypothetical protein
MRYKELDTRNEIQGTRKNKEEDARNKDQSRTYYSFQVFFVHCKLQEMVKLVAKAFSDSLCCNEDILNS